MTIEDELSRLLQAERAVQPPPSALATGWQRLAVDLATHAPAMTVAGGPLKMAVGIVPKWLAGGFAVGLLGAGTASLVAPPAPVPQVVRVVAPSAAPHAAPPATSPPPELAQPIAPEPTAVPNARAVAPVPSASAAPPRATFDAELELVSLAKAELDAQQNAQARQTLARHAELFPHGVFATERDALAMVAQCQQGPKNPTLGARFAALHPGSPLVQRVERACAVRAPSADFPTLPNGSDAPGERTAEPSGGTNR